MIYASYKKYKKVQSKIEKLYYLEITVSVHLYIHTTRDKIPKRLMYIPHIHCYLNSTEETEAEANEGITKL